MMIKLLIVVIVFFGFFQINPTATKVDEAPKFAFGEVIRFVNFVGEQQTPVVIDTIIGQFRVVMADTITKRAIILFGADSNSYTKTFTIESIRHYPIFDIDTHKDEQFAEWVLVDQYYNLFLIQLRNDLKKMYLRYDYDYDLKRFARGEKIYFTNGKYIFKEI